MITEATTFEPTTWSLTPGEYAATVAKIAKINERAQAKGFTGSLEVIGTREERTTFDSLTGFEVTEVVYSTRVTGTAPSYGGYVFLARIDRVGESFVISSAPGVDHVERSTVRPGECDHCGFNRQRNSTYLVRNEITGEIVNVGSTCIKDFLGWNASVTFFSDSDMQVEQGGFYAAREYSVDTILALAVAAIKAFGWRPASFEGTVTRDFVARALMSTRLSEIEKAEIATLRSHVEEATTMVEDIKAYILSDDFNGQSTYVENLKVLVAAESVSARQFGMLVSAPNAYLRSLEKAAEKKAAQAKDAGSEWVGAEKDKVEIKGTVEAVRYSSNNYGTTTVYTLLAEDGNLFTWFSTNGALGDDAGVAFHVKGTIKGHEEFNGSKRTVLTRCKAI